MDLRGQVTNSLMPSVAAACGLNTGDWRLESQSVEMRHERGNFVFIDDGVRINVI